VQVGDIEEVELPDAFLGALLQGVCAHGEHLGKGRLVAEFDDVDVEGEGDARMGGG